MHPDVTIKSEIYIKKLISSRIIENKFFYYNNAYFL
jgi:hypothetical protein